MDFEITPGRRRNWPFGEISSMDGRVLGKVDLSVQWFYLEFIMIIAMSVFQIITGIAGFSYAFTLYREPRSSVRT